MALAGSARATGSSASVTTPAASTFAIRAAGTPATSAGHGYMARWASAAGSSASPPDRRAPVCHGQLQFVDELRAFHCTRHLLLLLAHEKGDFRKSACYAARRQR